MSAFQCPDWQGHQGQTALINLEHIKSYLPDSTFNRYGKVTALFAEEITEGPLAGKMALYADVEPTESLVELVKKGQKLFTSMEVSPKFADTGKASLVGLAATDDPPAIHAGFRVRRWWHLPPRCENALLSLS